jgi:hypothetical protein
MKVKLNTELVGVDEKPLIDAETKKNLTVRMMLTNAVLADVEQSGNPVRGDSRVKRYELWLKIKGAKDAEELELTPEEATLLRDAVLVFPTLIAGQVRAALA